MTPFVWTDEFATGVRRIDEEHQRLFGLVDSFYQALGKQDARGSLGTLLGGLADYTRYHFSTEEALMRRWAFPGRAAHEAQHQAFVDRVAEMAERFSDGGLVLSLEATGFIRSWLSSHVLVTDKELGHFLASLGVR
jgi:hemerythrin